MIQRMSTAARLDKPDDAETQWHAKSGRRTTLTSEPAKEGIA